MKRILLKLSGEAISGSKGFGFDEATVIGVAKQVKQIVDAGGGTNQEGPRPRYSDRHNYRRRQFLARAYQ